MSTPTKMLCLYEDLDSALHSVSLTLHILETEGTERSILDYEHALNVASAARAAIGKEHDEDMARRDEAACLKF